MGMRYNARMGLSVSMQGWGAWCNGIQCVRSRILACYSILGRFLLEGRARHLKQTGVCASMHPRFHQHETQRRMAQLSLPLPWGQVPAISSQLYGVGMVNPWRPHLQEVHANHQHVIRPYQHIIISPTAHAHKPQLSSITVRNLANLLKDTLRMVEDEENPGSYLLAFSFDADAAGSFHICFLAKVGTDCSILPWLPDIHEPIQVSFDKGCSQEFKQAAGTGIYLDAFEARLIEEEGPDMVCPLVVKSHTDFEPPCKRIAEDGNEHPQIANVQLTQAIFKRKENGDCSVRVLRQIVWVNRVRYELHDLYGAESANTTVQSLDTCPEDACVICLSNGREIAVMPCRHMCMCNPCAAILTSKMAQCPMCREHVQSLLRIKVGSRTANKNYVDN